MVDQSAQVDQMFRALADPARRAIVAALAEGEKNVSELSAPLDMSLAGASKHVGVLEKAGLIACEKRGRERICMFRPDAMFLVRDWVEQYSTFWNARLDALDRVLKEDSNG